MKWRGVVRVTHIDDIDEFVRPAIPGVRVRILPTIIRPEGECLSLTYDEARELYEGLQRLLFQMG